MKISNIITGLAVIAASSLMVSCESDYLTLEPETSLSNSEVTKTTESAQKAIYGICMTMQTQYSGTTLEGFLCNGESNINQMFGEAFGQDQISPICLGRQFSVDALMYRNWGTNTSYMAYIPWEYYYLIISQANLILDGIDNAEGADADREFIKGQALTFRAHAYTKLLQFYAPRWEDSENGSKYCLVLRKVAGTAPVPLSTMSEVLDFIYNDLDNAITCFNNSDTERVHKWEPDQSVAYGVYARAALLKHDWAKAQTMAQNARSKYTVMDNNTYLGGFFADNNDFMWVQGTDETDIYYYSWGSLFSANGAYVVAWDWGGNAIDLSLYNLLDKNDIRRQCYLTPDKLDDLKLSSTLQKANITYDSFWDPDLVGVGKACIDLAAGSSNSKKPINGKWGMYNVALRICENFVKNVFTGNKADILNTGNEGVICYYQESSQGVELLSKGVYGKFPNKCPFGAQFKFMSYVPFGTSAYSFMRASEMCLIEAEASYMAGDTKNALKCLKEINDQRIPGYAFNAEDASLLEEIKLCRRIELWGEGYSWSDFKRWNIDINRVAWDKDAKAGNWVPDVSGVISKSAGNGWRYPVPQSETQYNTAIDENLLPQGN